MFKFKLEPVLALKEKVEDNKKRELGMAIQYQENIHIEKLALIQKKNEALNEAQSNGQAYVNIQSLKLFNTYNTYINEAIEEKDKEFQKAKKQVALKREELLEAVKERKILDNLKEIHLEAFREEEKQEEQRITDDLVTYKYGRKGKE